MGLLEGKRILVTGVLTDASLAFAVARLAQAEGAEVVLSGAGRGLSLTRRTARKLPVEADVLEIDVTEPDQLAAAAATLTERWDRLDGMLHAIGFAPPECLGGDMFQAGWDEVQVALHVSAYSLEGPGRGVPTPPGGGRYRRRGRGLGGGSRLRRHRGLALLRLDGRVQGRTGVLVAVPGP